jgi:2-oxoglutarate dehydrogenase E2 component (dihydrolipoamide succinyltransferase)
MAKYKLLLPKMGESVAEATIIKWTKNPGDYIESDETVMEIATDKVDSDVPSPVSGKLLEQLYKDNDVVQVGAAIAIIETNEPEEIEEEQGTAPVNHPVQEERPVVSPVQQPVREERPVATEYFATPEPVKNIPEEVKQPVFTEQRKEYSEPVPFTENLEQRSNGKTDDAKNSLRFYSPLVKNIAAQEGISNAELEQIPGTGAEGRLTKDDLLNYIQTRYQSAPDLQNKTTQATEENRVKPSFEPSAPAQSPVAEAPKPQPIMETPKPQPVAEAVPPVEVPRPEPVFEAPKPEPVKQQPADDKATSSSLSGGDEIIEMDRMRRLIADHMVMSKHTSPHVTSFVEADVTNLVLWRERIKGNFEKREGEKITFTPIFIEAVVRAIKDLPMINISVNGTQIIKKKDINISMATALPNGNLIVPVIKRADELNLIGLTKAVNDLANRARTGKLKPDDVQGGTFTITNVGSFGNVMGTPIINQPQVAILAVGAIRKKPAVIETLQGDMIGIRHMMFLSLSYDHRVVDGALGGSFVKRVSDYLENWDTGREI